MFIYIASPDPSMARLGLVISSRMYLQSVWIIHHVQQVEYTELQDSGVPRGGGLWGSNTPRNSEGPPKRANLNPIVKTVKNC